MGVDVGALKKRSINIAIKNIIRKEKENGKKRWISRRHGSAW